MRLRMAGRDLENATERRRRLARERYAAKKLLEFERARQSDRAWDARALAAERAAVAREQATSA